MDISETIQNTDPQLEVLMVELQTRMKDFLSREVGDISHHLGLHGRIDIKSRGACMGQDQEIMIVTIISKTS